MENARRHSTAGRYETVLLREVALERRGASSKNKGRQCEGKLGWLMGLEPTTTGITILDSTN